MTVKNIAQTLEAWAPLSLQESYDNAGLICGDPNQPIEKVLLSLDCIEATVDEAIQHGCGMIVSHHPIVFSGLNSLTGETYVERVILKAIKNDIALYAIHTNLDSIWTGVNRKIGNKLGLENLEILSPKQGKLKKLYTYVPVNSADIVRDALFAAGGGQISHYEECSYNTEGFGTFKAGENSNPTVGERLTRHTEKEIKIEVLFPSHLENTLISALVSCHPYEEVAYEIISLDNRDSRTGSGMVGDIKTPMDVQSFLSFVSKTFDCSVIKHTPPTSQSIERVAFCGGSGRFLLETAKCSGAQVYITSDFKYHDYFDADEKIMVIDIGHFESEQFTPELMKEYLEEKIPTFAVLLSEVNSNPIRYYISE